MDEALRLVEERNSSRNLAPAARAVGLRVQFEGTEMITVTPAAAETTMSKVSLTEPPLPSLAVTSTETVPTSAACGVPEKVRVPAAKASHVGSAVSSVFIAV